MQCLPNIELLAFLNWMDTNGRAFRMPGVPTDLLFVDLKYQEDIYKIEGIYASQADPGANAAQRYIDYGLSALKEAVEKRMRLHCAFPWEKRRSPIDLLALFQESLHDLSNDHLFALSMRAVDLNEAQHYYQGKLADSIRYSLDNNWNTALYLHFRQDPNSLAGIVSRFVEWTQRKEKLKDSSLRNIPTAVMRQYIDEYMWENYRYKQLTQAEKELRAKLLTQTLIGGKYADYLAYALRDRKKMHLNQIIQRSFNRSVRFKCTLLAHDDTFSHLVRDHWHEMNSYSADYLDIYYSDAELEQKGWSTADKLQIRDRITSYPAIFLWEYNIRDGICVPVSGLECGDLMDLIKVIVDTIARDENLTGIGQTAISTVQNILTAKSIANQEEEILTGHLLDTCAALQGNESWTREVNENGRNTYIRDLLRAKGYVVSDQELSGLSPTKKSAGELDIKVYTKDNRPFAIIEGLNITGNAQERWDKKAFRSHVHKLYNYDSNGLPRNYVVAYVTSPDFEQLASQVIQELENIKKCGYDKAVFQELTEQETGYADIRMGCARYTRNGKDTRVYLLCVRISDPKA